MTNSTAPLTFRDYPYARTIWKDDSGEYRWTINITVSITLSAVFSLILAYSLGRFLCVIYSILHFSFLDKRRKTVVDDQVSTIAINNESPSGLLMFLFHLVRVQPRHALSSIVFWAVASVALIFWIVQVLMTVTLGYLFLTDPIPYSPGTCGAPIVSVQNGSKTMPVIGSFNSYRTALFSQASLQYMDCSDDGNTVTCPGPAGQSFSWQVQESYPSYCWFGPGYCYGGSKTISLKATVTPKDLGTLRNSPMSLTIMLECSHVNSTEFIRRVKDHYTFEFGSPGYPIDPESPNATIVIYDYELMKKGDIGYQLKYALSTKQESLSWIPPPFLKSRSDSPFLTDKTTAESSVNMIFNQLFHVVSFYRNDDPFFLTTPIAHNGFYPPGQAIGTLACRERYQLVVAKDEGSWVETGTFHDIQKAWDSYPGRSVLSPSEQNDLDLDFILLTYGIIPSITQSALFGLGGNALHAQQSTLLGAQVGLPQNVTTRIEVTRWFGVAMLYILNTAYMFTSGTTNNWRFGIQRFADSAWVCDSTLRYDSGYTSVKVSNIVIIISLVMVITTISYGIQPLLGYFALRVHNNKWSKQILDSYISLTLHGILQLHRIAVEETTGQKFDCQLHGIPVIRRQPHSRDAGRAPVYGITTERFAALLQPPREENEQIELGNIRQRVSRSSEEPSVLASNDEPNIDVEPRGSQDIGEYADLSDDDDEPAPMVKATILRKNDHNRIFDFDLVS